MEIGVWTGLYNDLDIETTVRHLAEIGWFHVEFDVVHIVEATKREWREKLKSLRELCQSLGVKAWQMHFHAEHIENAHRWMEYCQILEVPYLVFHTIGPRVNRSLKEIKKTIELNVETFKEIVKFAEDLGVKVALENAGSLRQVSDLKEIINGAGSPFIGICLDTSHANMDGLDLEETIYECGRLLWATHISDNDGTGDQHRIPYNASYWGKPINWIKVARALRKINYQNLFMMEILGEGIQMVPKGGGKEWGPGNFAPSYVRDQKLAYAKNILKWLFDQQ